MFNVLKNNVFFYCPYFQFQNGYYNYKKIKLMEEWKIILNYPNYEVSNLGNVRNIKTKRILKTGVNPSGYYIITLNQKNKTIHKLVALAFIPNPNNLPIIDHIDRNKLNNCVSNLRWTTRSENCLNTDRRYKELFGIQKSGNNYRVAFSIDKKFKYFGSRKTLEEAIILRNNILKTDK